MIFVVLLGTKASVSKKCEIFLAFLIHFMWPAFTAFIALVIQIPVQLDLASGELLEPQSLVNWLKAGSLVLMQTHTFCTMYLPGFLLVLYPATYIFATVETLKIMKIVFLLATRFVNSTITSY